MDIISDNGLLVNICGMSEQIIKLNTHNFKFSFHQLFICSSGKGKFICENCFEKNFCAGDAILIQAGMKYAIKSEGDNLILKKAAFSGKYISAAIYYFTPLSSVVIKKINDDIKIRFNELFEVYSNNSSDDKQLSLKMYGILIELGKEITRQNESVKPDIHKSAIQPFVNYIEKHYFEPDIENTLLTKGFTSEQLDALFIKAYGVSLSDFILSYRLEMSKINLVLSPHIHEAGEASGLFDKDFFIQAFHNKFGISPEDLKNSYISPNANRRCAM